MAEAAGSSGDAPPTSTDSHQGRREGFGALALGAIGVVFGDIGTSPIYAMREALDSARVDVAILWSLCRESFSFAAYEAAAAGAAILTGPDSGNIAAFTSAGGHGLVLPDEASLFAQFESGTVQSLSRKVRRPEIFEIEYSGMSVDLLEALS
jgi:hypothetical protein